MNRLHESLLILNHFYNVINERNKYCKRYIGFTVESCVSSKLINSMYEGKIENPLKNQINHEIIARECADTKIMIHNYLCLNIIDMFSFNDEYINYFNEKLTDDEKIKKRIRLLRKENKLIRNNIDWKQLKRFRNIILAHNLRDKKNNNKLSLLTFVHLNNLIGDFENAIQYCEIIIEMFEKIEKEFKVEIENAQKSLADNTYTFKEAQAQQGL